MFNKIRIFWYSVINTGKLQILWQVSHGRSEVGGAIYTILANNASIIIYTIHCPRVLYYLQKLVETETLITGYMKMLLLFTMPYFSIQIMNVYECNGKNIFTRWKMKMFHSTKRSWVKIFFPLHEWKNIHYLFIKSAI